MKGCLPDPTPEHHLYGVGRLRENLRRRFAGGRSCRACWGADQDGAPLMKHRTEQVYDDEMAPLVTQLIAIAKREGIPLVVSAGMLDNQGTPMGCTTLLAHMDGPAKEELCGMSNRYGLAVGIIRGHSGFDTASGMVITRHHPR